jgi:hypothetical protein
MHLLEFGHLKQNWSCRRGISHYKYVSKFSWRYKWQNVLGQSVEPIQKKSLGDLFWLHHLAIMASLMQLILKIFSYYTDSTKTNISLSIAVLWQDITKQFTSPCNLHHLIVHLKYWLLKIWEIIMGVIKLALSRYTKGTCNMWRHFAPR